MNENQKNPVKAKLVPPPQDWVYRSASNYAEGQGIIDEAAVDELRRGWRLVLWECGCAEFGLILGLRAGALCCRLCRRE